MINQVQKRDLGYLGLEFQYRFIKSLMEDNDLFRDLQPIIDQNMFTEPMLKIYVGSMKDYYEKNDAFPSYEMMGIVLNNLSKSEADRMMFEELNKKIRNTSMEGNSYIKETAIKFFRQQNIIKCANKILSIAGEGNIDKYDECIEILQEANARGASYNLGEHLFDELTETLSADYREPIPTGIDKLDEALNGGLGKGELGLIIGSSSFGKTSITTAMSSYASTYKCAANLEQGYKVLQIVFEDGVKAIKRKHIARLTNIEACNLSKPEYIEEVKRIIGECEDYEMLQKNLRILALPTGEINANQIKEKIKQLHNTGFFPDMVVLDYFECLDMGDVRNGENEFNKEGRVMRKLEHMAKDYNFALWVTTQGTRDSVNAEIVTMDKAGGSFKKVQIAHVVLSIARTTEDIKNNKATLALLKNRAGGSGSVWTNVSFNNGTCRISTDNVEDYDDLFEYKKKRDKDEVDLQMAIFKKYKKQEKNDEG